MQACRKDFRQRHNMIRWDLQSEMLERRGARTECSLEHRRNAVSVGGLEFLRKLDRTMRVCVSRTLIS